MSLSDWLVFLKRKKNYTQFFFLSLISDWLVFWNLELLIDSLIWRVKTKQISKFLIWLFSIKKIDLEL